MRHDDESRLFSYEARKVFNDVEVEPHLQLINGENFLLNSTCFIGTIVGKCISIVYNMISDRLCGYLSSIQQLMVGMFDTRNASTTMIMVD